MVHDIGYQCWGTPDREIGHMTRRELLHAFGIVLRGAIGFVFPACATRRQAAGSGSSAPPSPVAKLSASETENLLALTEVLVQGRALSTSERGDVLEALNERMLSSPGHLRLYQVTASFLDQLVPARFADLSRPQRTEVVLRHRLFPGGERDASDRPPSMSEPMSEPEAAVRSFAIPDLIAAYYGSPAGWAMVAYTSFPGRCSNLLRYTRSE